MVTDLLIRLRVEPNRFIVDYGAISTFAHFDGVLSYVKKKTDTYPYPGRIPFETWSDLMQIRRRDVDLDAEGIRNANAFMNKAVEWLSSPADSDPCVMRYRRTIIAVNATPQETTNACDVAEYDSESITFLTTSGHSIREQYGGNRKISFILKPRSEWAGRDAGMGEIHDKLQWNASVVNREKTATRTANDQDMPTEEDWDMIWEEGEFYE